MNGITIAHLVMAGLDCRVHRIKSGGGLPGHFDPGTGNDGFLRFRSAQNCSGLGSGQAASGRPATRLTAGNAPAFNAAASDKG